jgi:hypothetical protein
VFAPVRIRITAVTQGIRSVLARAMVSAFMCSAWGSTTYVHRAPAARPLFQKSHSICLQFWIVTSAHEFKSGDPSETSCGLRRKPTAAVISNEADRPFGVDCSEPHTELIPRGVPPKKKGGIAQFAMTGRLSESLQQSEEGGCSAGLEDIGRLERIGTDITYSSEQQCRVSGFSKSTNLQVFVHIRTEPPMRHDDRGLRDSDGLR